MKSLLLILIAFGVLVVQGTVGELVPLDRFAPNFLLPIVIYLGVTPSVHLVRGALIAFTLGYLLDFFAGSPMGIQTLAMEATFVLSRFAGLRLLMQGQFLRALLTFIVALLMGGIALALQAIFETPPPFQVVDPERTMLRIALPAFSTALVAPVVFALVARLESSRGRRSDEAGP